MDTAFLSTENIPLSEVKHSLLSRHSVKLFVKRDDLIHPFISGNKWRKLKYNIEEMQRERKNTMLTFGGAYSNHILATAAAGNQLKFKTIGIIRGEEPTGKNPLIKEAMQFGMQMHFITREAYRLKETGEFQKKLGEAFGDFYLVPEGGASEFGVKGCEEITREIGIDYTHICCCCGTGATLAGIALSIPSGKTAIGFCVHKGGEPVAANISRWTGGINNYFLNSDYHFGGFAKSTSELTDFTSEFFAQTNIPVEPVYTAKMFYGIFDLIQNNFFKPGSVVIALHTGGIHNYL